MLALHALEFLDYWLLELQACLIANNNHTFHIKRLDIKIDSFPSIRHCRI